MIQLKRLLETSPVDLSKLNVEVKSGLVKKVEYGKLVEKVNNINNTDIDDSIKNKLTITQRLGKLKKTHLIMIMVNILLFTILIIYGQIIFLQN